ncbi:MAG: DUF2800 domain-containing protein [Oscillospiraceae bacterium]|nr:DUF2800 domain-containing protein [Oscillospiraceae bacterium]
MAKHSTFSASSADRWIHCPGSVHMASLFPPTTTPAAEEGTLAHALAAALIEGARREALDAIEAQVTSFYSAHPELSDTFTNMLQTIDPYIDYVNREYQESLARDPAAVLLTEQRVDFSDVVPGGFGTSDVVIIGGGRVTVIDLKYGKGVPVSAKDNPQIRLYAIGAINAYNLVYDFDRVKMVIYQPRLDSVTEEEMAVDALREWAGAVVKPAAELATLDEPPYHPGEWCASHFCPGAGACRARAEYILALERHSGKDPALLTDEELSDALSRADALQKWAKALNSYALGEIQTGHAIPGWKIVEGRSNRRFTDEDQVVAAAVGAGYSKDLLYTASLIGITEMEKLMGKKQFKAILGSLVVKPAGDPKLAPESDRRPAFNQAKTEFDD